MNGIKVTDRRGQNRSVDSTVPDAKPEPKPKTLQQLIDECPLRPTLGRMVFLNDPMKDKVGKIHIPETAKRRGTTGVILKINSPESVFKTGDRILIGRYSGTLIEFENRPAWHIIQEEEILSWVDTDDQLVDQTVG